MGGDTIRLGEVPRVGLRSYWLTEALAADPGAPCPVLPGAVVADVCIVGGGFAGLWTAYELGERAPGLDIVVLEADVCGAGGSGANGGFFSCSWHMIATLCQWFGEEAGVRYAEALAAQIDEIEAWVARHGAQIHLHREGIVYARAGEWQPEPSREGLAVLARHGHADRLREVSGDEARRVADSPRLLGGVFTPDLATVQPARLARDLRRVLLERGVRIYEGTPMTALRAGRPAEVIAAGGSVSAAQVVLTTGAWAAGEAHFARSFAVATDFMVVTERIPERLAEIGWTSHTGLADSRDMLYYLRRTDDDRIAIGGGGMGAVFGARIRGRAVSSPTLARAAAHGLVWLFPQLEGVRFDAAWSGPMDLTRSGAPFFFSAPSGDLHAGLGFSGHGLAATKLGGKTLASLVLGADDEWARLPVVGPPPAGVPPEPLRWPMVASLEWLLRRADLGQEAGRRPNAVQRAAARAFETYSNSRTEAGPADRS